MPKLNRQSGANIRELALKRRVKAIAAFASAGLVIFLPFFLVKSFESILKPIFALNRSPAPSNSFNLLLVFYAISAALSLILIGYGIYLWKRADRADRGAKGEEDIAQEMLQLESEGWQIEYGMRLGNRLGDADIVCISPQGKAYVIDVKSHRGEVTTDENQLYRRMGNKTYSFEKNFLDRAMKQALQVKKQKSLSFVTPMVAFSNAKVSVPSGKIKGVYVVERSRLLPLLKVLG